MKAHCLRRLSTRLLSAGPLALLLVWVPAATAQGPGAGPALGADLGALIAHAHQHNPALAAGRMDAAAAQARVGAATALPDPQIELELMDVGNAMNPGRSASLLPGRVGTTRWRATQVLPYPGKRALREGVAQAQATGADADVLQTRLDVEAAVVRAYTAHYQSARQAHILGESLALNGHLTELALDRYARGLGGQQAVWTLQAERAMLRIEAAELERRRAGARLQLNALLDRPADAALAEPQALPPAPAPVALSVLLEQAARQSPLLGKARADLLAAERSLALTQRERYPDFGVSMANNRPRGGRDSWDLRVEINVPLQQASRRALEREAAYGQAAAQARQQEAAARLAEAVGEAHATLVARAEQLRLLQTVVLPQNQAALESARAGYERGVSGFEPVLAAQQRLLASRLSLLEAEVQAALAAADLKQRVGDFW